MRILAYFHHSPLSACLSFTRMLTLEHIYYFYLPCCSHSTLDVLWKQRLPCMRPPLLAMEQHPCTLQLRLATVVPHLTTVRPLPRTMVSLY